MRHLRLVLTIVGTVTVLVLAGNTVALATTGQGFLLGKTNTANTVTILKRTTSGTPLSIHSSSNANAPLAVNGTGKVTHLNADKVDSLDSAILANRTSIYTRSVNVTGTNSFALRTPTKSAGTYLISVSGWIDGPSSGDSDYLNCLAKGGGKLIEQYLPVNADGVYTLSINGTLVLPSAQYIEISCVGPTGNYKSFSADLVRVSLTKVGIPSSASLTVP
jgi:hypothetical protein